MYVKRVETSTGSSARLVRIVTDDLCVFVSESYVCPSRSKPSGNLHSRCSRVILDVHKRGYFMPIELDRNCGPANGGALFAATPRDDAGLLFSESTSWRDDLSQKTSKHTHEDEVKCTQMHEIEIRLEETYMYARRETAKPRYTEEIVFVHAKGECS